VDNPHRAGTISAAPRTSRSRKTVICSSPTATRTRASSSTAPRKEDPRVGHAGNRSRTISLAALDQIDEDGIVYVADRENGRIQRFTQDGTYLGEWAAFGKTFSLKVESGAVWLATQPRDQPNLSPGWLMKIDRKTGSILGYVEVAGVHGMDAMPNGEVMVGPGPDAKAPQWFRTRQR
jgi:NHL repeat